MAAGPLTAMLLSVLISLTNVAVSTCAGYFAGRWIDYGVNAADSDAPEFAQKRALARVLLVVFLVVIGLFHITVGLVRAQESLDSVEHGIVGYALMLTTPEALFLILIGACMSALAYFKGMRAFDDPYPGYGERHRAVLAIQDEVVGLFEDTTEQIESRFEEVEEKLDKASATQKRTLAKYNKAVRACLDSQRALQQETMGAQSAFRAQVTQLTAHYRTVRGQDAQALEPIPDQLVSFDGFADTEIPPFAQPPDGDERRARLQEAKSAALKRLSQLFLYAFDDKTLGDFR